MASRTFDSQSGFTKYRLFESWKKIRTSVPGRTLLRFRAPLRAERLETMAQSEFAGSLALKEKQRRFMAMIEKIVYWGSSLGAVCCELRLKTATDSNKLDIV